MALTTPFISSITAFDASLSKQISVNVLGGDAITKIYYTIVDTNNTTVASGNFSVVDSDTDKIRTFTFTLSANTLLNNTTYKIKAYSTDGNSNSNYSQYEIFTCYQSPSFTFKYYNGSSWAALTSSVVISAVDLKVQLTFNKNDAQSPAILNDAQISVYGVDSNSIQTLVYKGSTLYNAPLEQTLSGFVPTSGAYAQYSKYLIVAKGSTVDGFEFTSQVGNLDCSYAITTGSILELTNFCSEGFVRVKTTYSSSSGVSYYNLQFKPSSSLDWITFLSDTNPSDGTDAWINFTVDFPFCANNAVYDFRIVLYASDNSVISSDVVQILSKFGKSFVCDSTTIYDITKEWTVGSYNVSNPNAIYQPFGSQFPFVTKNAVTLYRSGQYTAVLLAPTSQSSISAYIDRNAQVTLKEQFEDWLANGNAKIIKDFNGSIRIVVVTDAVASSYYQHLGNGIASSTFTWSEIGSFTQEYFDYLGLTNSFDLNYYL